VFERFTDASRTVVVLAQDECRLLGHDTVGTVHLIAALTRIDDPVAELLAGMGVTTASVRGQVTRMLHPGGPTPGELLPLAVEASQALGQAPREALRLGHDRVQPGHVLLALLEVHDGNLPVLFARLGVTAPVLRERTTALLEGGPPPGPAAALPAPERASAAPVCARCGSAISLHVVDTDAGVRVAACRHCGAVVGAWPA
jgi:ATP-dependent Clp protease ATP-binding subunit ClpC